MKIISGIYKGRNIEGYNINGTRPTMERVKESLFATIQNYIPESVVLDLFSGSGNLAIEALSQGAKEAYAVDNNPIACKYIKQNIEKIGVKNCQVLKGDYLDIIEILEKQKLKFDLIILDPPYNTNYIEKSIEKIELSNILKTDGIIVCENDSLDRIVYPNTYEVLKEKKYGDKWVVILKKIC